jgi:hypothetical protein
MSTTESVESVESVQSVEVIDLEVVLATLKLFGAADLFKVIKTATTRVETLIKKGAKAKKEDGPKKPTPPQLQKPKAWVSFTLKHAQQHGWEEFIRAIKNEEIEMPASEEKDGKHLYPDGKQMIMTHAMSLSKQRWSPKAKEGTHKELYEEFSAEFEQAKEDLEAPEWLAPPKTVRKTAAEKEAEMAEKKRLAEETKAKKKEEREKAKEETKNAKMAEKTAKVPKAAVKEPKTKEPKAKEPKTKEPKASSKEEAKPVPMTKAMKKALAEEMAEQMEPAKKPVKKPVAATATAAVWSCPADGAVHPWMYKGTAYLRNSDNEVWLEDSDGGCGEWQGVYDVADGNIDNMAKDPYADADEDENEDEDEDEDKDKDEESNE